MIVRRATAFHLPRVPHCAPAPVLRLVVIAPPEEEPPAPVIIGPPVNAIALVRGAVAAEFGLDLEELVGPSHKRAIAQARQLGMYLAHRITGRQLRVVGRAFGRGDHTTVLHAIRATRERLAVPSEWCRRHEAVCLALLSEVPA